MNGGASRRPPRASGHHGSHMRQFPLARQSGDVLSRWTTVVPFFLPMAPMLSCRYRRKRGFRPFRPFRTAVNFVAASDGRAMAAVSANSASVMPVSTSSAGRPLPGFCNSRNFRKRYANGRCVGVPVLGGRTARARTVATGISLAPHRGPEIDVGRGRVQCWRAMALREIAEASEHDADPVEGSAYIRHNIAWLRQGQDVRDGCTSGAQDSFFTPRRGRARVHAVHAIGTRTSTKSADDTIASIVAGHALHVRELHVARPRSTGRHRAVAADRFTTR